MLGVDINAADLFPTVSELIAAPMPSGRVYDGVSLMPLLDGKPLARRADEPFYYYNCENLQAVRLGDWKLIRFYPKPQKKMNPKPAPYMELYNVKTYPSEENDVAKKHPECVSELLREMRGMMDDDTIINDPEK